MDIPSPQWHSTCSVEGGPSICWTCEVPTVLTPVFSHTAHLHPPYYIGTPIPIPDPDPARITKKDGTWRTGSVSLACVCLSLTQPVLSRSWLYYSIRICCFVSSLLNHHSLSHLLGTTCSLSFSFASSQKPTHSPSPPRGEPASLAPSDPFWQGPPHKQASRSHTQSTSIRSPSSNPPFPSLSRAPGLRRYTKKSCLVLAQQTTTNTHALRL